MKRTLHTTQHHRRRQKTETWIAKAKTALGGLAITYAARVTTSCLIEVGKWLLRHL